jgi:hypothetical protein
VRLIPGSNNQVSREQYWRIFDNFSL